MHRRRRSFSTHHARCCVEREPGSILCLSTLHPLHFLSLQHPTRYYCIVILAVGAQKPQTWMGICRSCGSGCACHSRLFSNHQTAHGPWHSQDNARELRYLIFAMYQSIYCMFLMQTAHGPWHSQDDT